MINLVSLLVVVALVSLQCDLLANAQIENSKMDLDNDIQPNVVQPVQQKRRWFLRVAEAPPKTARLVPGSTLELTCRVAALPAPTVHWLKNGNPISDYEESNEISPEYSISLGEMTSKLVVHTATSGDVFTCVGTSGAVEKATSTTVYTVGDQEDDDLLESLMFSPTKPTVTRYYNNVFLPMGHTIILPCRAVSNTKSKVYWHSPNNHVIYNNGHRRVLPSGDLLINDLMFSDMGNYTCTAQNMYGKETVETFLYTLKV